MLSDRSIKRARTPGPIGGPGLSWADGGAAATPGCEPRPSDHPGRRGSCGK